MSLLFRRFYGNKIFSNIYFLKTDEKARIISSVENGIKYYSLNNEQCLHESVSEKQGLTVNKYTSRTHTCGELTKNHIGTSVILYGWLEYQRMNKFLVLRDAYGETQLLLSEEDKCNQHLLSQIPYETIIKAKGVVFSRPVEMVNPKQKTGEIEVHIEDLSVVNKVKNMLPFNIREFQKAKEALRMQYRYLDLRFPQMQRNLRVRSMLLMKMREFLIKNQFVDVETPTLFKATPGGAQEFIVPTRTPHKFYSLVQSPQQFKQMLMCGAIDRYFQIAKCYRDEGSRPDRQPEFTQLDIELSFTDMEEVIKLIESLLYSSLIDFYPGIPKQFPRMSYEDAMEKYGTDQPDVTFSFELQNCTDIFKNNKNLINACNVDFGVYVLVFNKKSILESCILTKSIKTRNEKFAAEFPRVKLIQSKVTRQDWPLKMNKLFSSQEAIRLLEEYDIEDESVIFLAYGNRNDARSLLGKIRLEYFRILEQDFNIRDLRKPGFHFLWIVDFPLFKLHEDEILKSVHHPFTAPHPDDVALLENNATAVKGLAYDLVLNGNEVGGGSIRIHDPDMQEKVLEMLKIKTESLQHIIDMLGSGCPPHGGIALGLDRLLAILLNAQSIRDVMAFPKTSEGKDPISQAPSEVSTDVLKMYHVQTVPDS